MGGRINGAHLRYRLISSATREHNDSAVVMSRFKELARIQAAIKHQNESELRWAAEYCQMRLRMAALKHHERYWRRIQREVTDALRSVAPPTD